VLATTAERGSSATASAAALHATINAAKILLIMSSLPVNGFSCAILNSRPRRPEPSRYRPALAERLAGTRKRRPVVTLFVAET